MRHLDAVDLVRCVAGEGLPEHITRHAESCPSCRIELRRLGHSVSAMLAPLNVAAASALLIVGAVYGGFHYAVDVVAGVVVGLVVAVAVVVRPARG